MNTTDFINNFVELFDDAPAGVTVETRFRDLEDWSSLIALGVMAMIDEEYDVQINAEEMRNASTIQDLINTVESHL